MTTTKLVKISELADLAGVPVPTIKHYIKEGLLPEPAKRTSRNMAYYNTNLVNRLKAIKILQQSRFLPLKVIKEILQPPPSATLREDLDDDTRRRLGTVGPLLAAAQQGSWQTARGRAKQMTHSEILNRLDIDDTDLKELSRLKLVNPAQNESGEPIYSGNDLLLLSTIHETRRAGMGMLFPMSILETYCAAIRTLVRVEIELFRSGVLENPLPPDISLKEVVDKASRLGEQLVLVLRQRILVEELSSTSE